MQKESSRELILQQYTQLVTLPSLALSSDFLSQENLLLRDTSNTLYPEMPTTTKLDFIYAR